ncbi:MAG: hypothetical protein AUJ12_04655 [Alphaproteobacteria bacterium CG1_02_46_17]|nr:MAG: hypothetical protein AUJ12_04655 [Alphaproteobacteria bacterium CG1_02_46_17]
MSLKLWFAQALGLDTKYAPAVKAIMEKSLGEVQTHFPPHGGDICVFFKHPIFIAKENDRNEYQLSQPEGHGRTKNVAVLDLFLKLTKDHHDLYVLRYIGENTTDKRQSDYAVFQYKQGDFHPVGTWAGNKKPYECSKSQDNLTLVPTSLCGGTRYTL